MINKEAMEIIIDGYLAGYMEKEAFLPIISTGGGSYLTNQGVGLNTGYSHAFGLIPLPEIGIRVGNENAGATISGPIPGIAVDNGLKSGKWNWNGIRSLWQVAKDAYENKRDIELENGKTIRIPKSEYNKLESLAGKIQAAEDEENTSKYLKAVIAYQNYYNKLGKTAMNSKKK